MQEKIRNNMPPVPLRTLFEDMHKENKLVDPYISAKVLIKLLEDDVYENGSHVDFYDCVGSEISVGH